MTQGVRSCVPAAPPAAPPAALFDALDATWPAAAKLTLAPFTIRDGQGGGKRVSAASADGPATAGDIDTAERAMAALGQPRLFVLRHDASSAPRDDAGSGPGEAAGPLDPLLARLGYRVVDPTLIRACPIGTLTAHAVPPVSAFAIWEPLQIICDIWAGAGIGAARIAVMHRATGPKTAFLARSRDRPAGAAFVALHGAVAMVHALEVTPDFRRQGAARNIMLAAAHWAAARGAQTMAVAVVQDNRAANALYASLDMPVCARYHYRSKD